MSNKDYFHYINKEPETMRPEEQIGASRTDFSFLTPLQIAPVATTSNTVGTLGEMLLSATVTNVSKKPLRQTVPYANYNRPLELGEARGYSRNWGDASAATQTSAMQAILAGAEGLSTEDKAILLGICRIESGFNPDAAATTTSASGLFQIIKSTGETLGLSQKNLFNMKDNIKAGVALFKEHARLVAKKYPHLAGDERAVMLYALHHDGPTLKYGGAQIGREKLVPFLNKFRAITAEASRL
jgi:soluble lytic murein transglycosylase-like protein